MLPCTKRRAPVHAGWTPLLPGAWGECRGWTPRQNPQGQRRHTVVRYARPPPLRRSLSPFYSLCSFLAAGIKGKLTFKEGGRATLPAFGRRLSRDGVRGYAPQINRCRGRQLFARWGGEIYSAPPGWQNPRGRGCLPVRRGA